MLEHGLAGAERSGDEARTAFGHRIEGVDGANARLHHARRTRLLDVAAHGLLHGPFLNHRDRMFAALLVGQDGDRVRHLVFPGRRHALDRIVAGHGKGHHDLMAHPLLLDFAQPRRGGHLVARLGQRRTPIGPRNRPGR